MRQPFEPRKIHAARSGSLPSPFGGPAAAVGYMRVKTIIEGGQGQPS
jgi:hypothetical protein